MVATHVGVDVQPADGRRTDPGPRPVRQSGAAGPSPGSDAEDVQHERMDQRGLLQPVESPCRASVPRLHVGMQQEQAVIGLRRAQLRHPLRGLPVGDAGVGEARGGDDVRVLLRLDVVVGAVRGNALVRRFALDRIAPFRGDVVVCIDQQEAAREALRRAPWMLRCRRSRLRDGRGCPFAAGRDCASPAASSRPSAKRSRRCAGARAGCGWPACGARSEAGVRPEVALAWTICLRWVLGAQGTDHPIPQRG